MVRRVEGGARHRQIQAQKPAAARDAQKSAEAKQAEEQKKAELKQLAEAPRDEADKARGDWKKEISLTKRSPLKQAEQATPRQLKKTLGEEFRARLDQRLKSWSGPDKAKGALSNVIHNRGVDVQALKKATVARRAQGPEQPAAAAQAKTVETQAKNRSPASQEEFLKLLEHKEARATVAAPGQAFEPNLSAQQSQTTQQSAQAQQTQDAPIPIS